MRRPLRTLIRHRLASRPFDYKLNLGVIGSHTSRIQVKTPKAVKNRPIILTTSPATPSGVSPALPVDVEFSLTGAQEAS